MYHWIKLPYPWNKHSIWNQPYSKIKQQRMRRKRNKKWNMKKCWRLVAIFCNSNSTAVFSSEEKVRRWEFLMEKQGLFNLNLRVWVRIQWKEGPPGLGLTGLVTWCGDWRHPNFPGHFQKNKEGGRTPWEPHWKGSLLWNKMHFSRKWRMASWFLKPCKDSVFFWRYI